MAPTEKPNKNSYTHTISITEHLAVVQPGLNFGLVLLILKGVKLTTEQFNAIFTFYDKVGDILINTHSPNTKGDHGLLLSAN